MPEPEDKDLTRIADLPVGEETPAASNSENPPLSDTGDADATRFSSTPDGDKTRFDTTPQSRKTVVGEHDEKNYTQGSERTQAGWQKTRPVAPVDVPTTTPSQDDNRIGLVLNQLWKVQEFIAKGGMGAVYEGIDHLGQKVAVKFLLADYAANQNIRKMFLDEARVLQELSKLNSTLVQYHACNDPEEGEPYIVMEYVDGPTLYKALPSLKPTVPQLLEFTRLLAAALDIAHKSGLIHRDLSPRNIMLSGGELLRAKIIDFGIAKNLAAAEGTTVAGFKGNLQYAAPEQFDERVDRQSPVGPHTDVYSLGLVVAALARGKPIPMGDSYLEAVKKREKVPGLAGVPNALRSLLEGMLQPDPQKRLRSMAEVLKALDRMGSRSVRRLAWAASVLILMGGGGAYYFLNASVLPENRERIAATLQGSDCTWLNLDSLARNWGTVRGKLSGFAGDVPSVTTNASKAAGFPVTFDTTEVSSVARQACGPLNAFRRFREPLSETGPSLIAQQRQFAVGNDPKFCPLDKLRQARVKLDLKLEDASTDFALLGFESNGSMQVLVAGRDAFEQLRKNSEEFAIPLGNGIYRLSFCVDEKTASRTNPNGVVGLVLVKGKGPFKFASGTAANVLGLDPNADDTAPVLPNWPDSFAAQAEKQGWQTQIAWYQVVTQ